MFKALALALLVCAVHSLPVQFEERALNESKPIDLTADHWHNVSDTKVSELKLGDAAAEKKDEKKIEKRSIPEEANKEDKPKNTDEFTAQQPALQEKAGHIHKVEEKKENVKAAEEKKHAGARAWEDSAHSEDGKKHEDVKAENLKEKSIPQPAASVHEDEKKEVAKKEEAKKEVRADPEEAKHSVEEGKKHEEAVAEEIEGKNSKLPAPPVQEAAKKEEVHKEEVKKHAKRAAAEDGKKHEDTNKPAEQIDEQIQGKDAHISAAAKKEEVKKEVRADSEKDTAAVAVNEWHNATLEQQKEKAGNESHHLEEHKQMKSRVAREVEKEEKAAVNGKEEAKAEAWEGKALNVSAPVEWHNVTEWHNKTAQGHEWEKSHESMKEVDQKRVRREAEGKASANGKEEAKEDFTEKSLNVSAPVEWHNSTEWHNKTAEGHEWEKSHESMKEVDQKRVSREAEEKKEKIDAEELQGKQMNVSASHESHNKTVDDKGHEVHHEKKEEKKEEKKQARGVEGHEHLKEEANKKEGATHDDLTEKALNGSASDWKEWHNKTESDHKEKDQKEKDQKDKDHNKEHEQKKEEEKKRVEREVADKVVTEEFIEKVLIKVENETAVMPVQVVNVTHVESHKVKRCAGHDQQRADDQVAVVVTEAPNTTAAPKVKRAAPEKMAEKKQELMDHSVPALTTSTQAQQATTKAQETTTSASASA